MRIDFTEDADDACLQTLKALTGLTCNVMQDDVGFGPVMLQAADEHGIHFYSEEHGGRITLDPAEVREIIIL